MMEMIPYATAAVAAILILELFTRRLWTLGYVLGTKRTERPLRYWVHILWQAFVLIAGIWLSWHLYLEKHHR
jgi:hypothetical protein